jgi:hypothetical protein
LWGAEPARKRERQLEMPIDIPDQKSEAWPFFSQSP